MRCCVWGISEVFVCVCDIGLFNVGRFSVGEVKGSWSYGRNKGVIIRMVRKLRWWENVVEIYYLIEI